MTALPTTLCYLNGEYLPLKVEGPLADHVFAFARRLDDWAAVTVAPRWFGRLGAAPPLGPVWAGNSIEAPLASDRTYRNMLSGEVLRPQQNGEGFAFALEQVLAQFPVALLVPGDA